MKTIRKRGQNKPLEQLILEIPRAVLDEQFAAKEINRLANILIGLTAEHRSTGAQGGLNQLRILVQEQIGCKTPSMYGTKDPHCGSNAGYNELLETHWEAPFILSYRTHKQLLRCGLLPDEIDLGSDAANSDNIPNVLADGVEEWQNTDRTPLAATLRRKGLAFGKCFCKFGSRQGTHPNAG